jgi:sugar phosphate isomerase/epimerase
VNPGPRLGDLRAIVVEIDRPEVGLALDTGHAHLTASPAEETLAAGDRLWTTHVHDNDGRQDTHEPPGSGSIDWGSWVGSLDEVGYEGPVMLECIRRIRQEPEQIDEGFLALMRRLTNRLK